MRWDPRRHLPIVAALAVIVAAIALVAPWWTLADEAGADEAAVSPFDPGPQESVVDRTAVTAVGILAFVGIIGLVGGLAVGFRSQRPERRATAGWLWMASGGFLLVAPLTAVLTWPSGDLPFWGTASAGGTTWGLVAGWGWYLTLVAGAMAAVAGMAWLLMHQSRAPEPETEAEPAPGEREPEP